MNKEKKQDDGLVYIISLIVIGLIYIGDVILLLLNLIKKILLLIVKYIFRLFNIFTQSVDHFGAYIIKRLLRSRPVKTKIKKLKKYTSLSKIRFFQKIKYFILGVIFTSLIVVIIQGYYFINNLPNPRLIGEVNYSVSSKIYDRNHKLLYEIYRDQNRTPVKINQLPDYIIKATIAIEDADFYNHQGISPIGGIIRAIKDSYITGRLQGGSTITQQLIKTALLTPERTWQRKIKEVILALWTEKIYTKQQILEMYLNQIPYGGAAYGIEEASKTYFGKSAKQLTLDQAALLVGFTQAPSRYSPYVNPALAIKRRNEVLNAMLDQGYINDFEYQEAVNNNLEVIASKKYISAPHFVFYVKSILEQKYGIKKVEEGGLKITTSLDLSLQKKIESILIEEITKISNLNVSNGAILVTVPSTGEVLAMIGSVDYFQQPYGAFNVTVAKRQPGSSIKPLLYSLALQKGFTAATIIDDTPIKYMFSGSQPYTPLNYDNRFHGPVPLRYAFANSYNIPAVKVLNQIGVDNFITHATKMGITTWQEKNRFGLALALGGGEVKMIDMAVAYGVLANSGNKVALNPIINVNNYQNNFVEKLSDSVDNQIIPSNVSYIISDILSDNFARRFAFGSHSLLEIDGYRVAVKTGTTNTKKDNWTIGYTPKYLVVVWVGNNDGTAMNQQLTSGVTGAAPIWHRVMSYLLNEYDKQTNNRINISNNFIQPDNLVKKKCYFGRDEYFISGTEITSCRSEQLTPVPSRQPTTVQ